MEPETNDAPQASTRRRMTLMLLSVGVLLGLLVGFNAFKNAMIAKSLEGHGLPPQTVTAAAARTETWQPSLSAVGTLRARRGADLAFELPGVVARVEALAGARVKAGQVLVAQNDDAEQAQLRQMQAAAGLAAVALRRGREQLAIKGISQSDYDSLEADLKGKEAAVQAQQAVLARKRVIAPFDGQVGIISTSPGAYVTPGAPVATLQQLDEVYADFPLPQRDLARIRAGQAVTLSLDAFPGRAFKGKVTAINPKVDNGTRNVLVEASFANPGHLLVPGMFANVTMDVDRPQAWLTLPQTAVTYNPYGSIVFLAVKDKDGGLHAQETFVTTGPTRGDQVAILKGLESGALVVTSGGLKLRNGTPLKVDNKVAPAQDPNPAPQEN